MRKLYAIPAVVAICLGMGSAASAQVSREIVGEGAAVGELCKATMYLQTTGALSMTLRLKAGSSTKAMVNVTGTAELPSLTNWDADGIEVACGLDAGTLTLVTPTADYNNAASWGVVVNDGVAGPVFIGFRVGGVDPAGGATPNPNEDPSNDSLADPSDPTPASEFQRNIDGSRQVIVGAAARSLQSSISANRGMVDAARDRFIESGQSVGVDGGVASRNDVDFDVDGTFAVDGTTLSSSGNFFQQTGNNEGTQRRLFFGDFDVQHDGDTGSTTATLTGRMAWEQMVSDSTMMGYFIGGELASSNIDGVLEGDQDRIGVTIGAYAVHQLGEQVYLDGFLTFGAGRNNLEMANDVLELESDYTTRSATIGAALSGVYDYGNYEFRPELAFSYGHTWIGNAGFTGRAYGLVDDTLSLDAGDVSIANLTVRPEVVWALDGTSLAESNSQLSFAPRLICESRKTVRRTVSCGGGAEFGLSSTSQDGLSTAEFRVIMDRVGDSTRSSLALNVEHRF